MKQKEIDTATCPICNKSFVIPSYNLKQVYCSRKCYAISRTLTKKETCPICNKLFVVPNTRPNQIYCSRDCSVIGRRLTKEDDASDRVDAFIETIPDLQIHDVLEGKLKMDHRMTVPGAGMWKDKRFIVLVVD